MPTFTDTIKMTVLFVNIVTHTHTHTHTHTYIYIYNIYIYNIYYIYKIFNVYLQQRFSYEHEERDWQIYISVSINKV